MEIKLDIDLRKVVLKMKCELEVVEENVSKAVHWVDHVIVLKQQTFSGFQAPKWLFPDYKIGVFLWNFATTDKNYSFCISC